MTTDTFTYSRTVALPPARLWPLLTNPDMRAIWGAPDEGTTLSTVSSDLRVGGVDHQICGAPDAPDFEQHTRWYRLAEPSDAVYTEVIQAGGMDLGASLVTLNVTEVGATSTLSVTVAVSSFVGPEMIAEFRGGWDASMGNLDRLFATYT